MCVQAADAARGRGHRRGGHRPALALTRTTGTRSRRASRRPNRVLFVNEDTEVTNFGEHLVRRTVEELFYELDAPPRLLAGAHVPGIGLADNLERASVPQVDGVAAAMRDLAKHEATKPA